MDFPRCHSQYFMSPTLFVGALIPYMRVKWAEVAVKKKSRAAKEWTQWRLTAKNKSEIHPQVFTLKSGPTLAFYETDDGKALDKEYAVCKNCLAKVKYNGNTTNMQSHQGHYHGELLSGDKKVKPSQPTIATAFKAKFPFGSPRAESIMNSIAEFICKDLCLYSVVENDGFRRMLTTLKPRYEVPSHKYFTEKALRIVCRDMS